MYGWAAVDMLPSRRLGKEVRRRELMGPDARGWRGSGGRYQELGFVKEDATWMKVLEADDAC
ncbi:hypothetical protein CVT26_003373 [Gymnopilus dilepis]|uniref:Uncharacterized protein n=1 Tax=Gymnopilus dilepis TaxID=231916 RepID=A0A409VQQ1_9AGAR|nr:hypothetical protein CVT26_003373 [Gymnopilus dilepis]